MIWAVLITAPITGALALQGPTVKGFVLEEDEKGNLKPVPFANVYWLENTSGTVTNDDGFFNLEIADTSNNTLVVSYVGYEADTLALKTNDELTIILRRNVNIEGVEVLGRSATTQISYLNPIFTQHIAQEELLKAACCNLSESFETNPAVDVSFTDAVTGTRQIQMLGLSGIYTYITRENMPDVRGLSSIIGLTYTPGPWIESIQLSKGTGSVVNGYESIAGQINVELRKSNETDLAHFNAYANQEGRGEVNFIVSPWIGPHLSTDIFIHANAKPYKMDGNDDGFMDFPTGDQINVLNRWKYDSHKGFVTQLAFRILQDNKQGGQMDYNDYSDIENARYWGMENNRERYEAWGKAGYVFPSHKYRSIGLQFMGVRYNMRSYFGRKTYSASQESLYANLIFQDIIGNTNHKYRIGAGILQDYLDEDYRENILLAESDPLQPFYSQQLKEQTPGVFAEYSFSQCEFFNMVAGIRTDFSSVYGAFITSRLHFRYAPVEKTTFRAGIGKGQRRSFVFAENMGRMASSRTFYIDEDNNSENYGLLPEQAINMGFSITQHFKIGYREGSFTSDFYHTRFINQVVNDIDDSPNRVLINNLDGESFANSLQAQVDYEIMRKFDIRLAYRWYDVNTNYRSGMLQKPLVAKHRAFINLAYETRKKWFFDLTANWQGQKRLPNMDGNAGASHLGAYAPSFLLMNGQIAKRLKNGLEVYVGMENITNYKQDKPILGANDPFGSNFDASIIYAPITGSMTYAGIRWDISRLKNRDAR